MGKQFCFTDIIELAVEIVRSRCCVLFKYTENKFNILHLTHTSLGDPVVFPLNIELLKTDKIYKKDPLIFNTNFEVESCLVLSLKDNEEILGCIVFFNLRRPSSKYIKKLQPAIKMLCHVMEQDMKKSSGIFKSESGDIILSNMSHEIRTPLNGIIGYNQLMAKTKLDDIQKNYMSVINTCCCQLLQIVNDVLDYAKLNSNKATLSCEVFSIKELINQVEDITGGIIKNKSQTFQISIDPLLPEFINTDKNKINQVLVNLVNNASKFTDNKGIIKVSVKDCKDGYMLFIVEDNGIGINKDEQKKLFNVFTQLKNTNVKLGTGLGLAISEKLIKLLEGDIWVNSEPGKGSIFSFTVKYTIPEKSPQEFIDNNINIVKSKYVLLVDDNSNNRIVISNYLFEFNMIPIICASPLEALDHIVNRRYPVVIGLIDICMPEISGVQLADQIKRSSPFFPMIALSSSKDNIEMSNFEYRLTKPINKHQLLNIIVKVILKYKSRSSFITAETQSQILSLHRRSTEHRRNTDNQSPRRDVNILVAEDVSYSATLLITMLESMEYKNTSIAIDGIEAIKKIDMASKRKKPYDIIFLDLKMPNADGYCVMDHIKKMKYNIKVVVVSASVLEQEKNKCVARGVEYFLSKPIQMNQLKDIISQVSCTCFINSSCSNLI